LYERSTVTGVEGGSSEVDAFWADFLGAEAGKFATDGFSVVAHHRLGDYHGVWFFLRGGRCVVSAPPAWTDRLRSALWDVPVGRIGEAAIFDALFGRDLEQVIGPTYQGFLSASRFRPVASEIVRAVDWKGSSIDQSAVEALLAACTSEDGDAAALDIERLWSHGSFEGDRLVAMAQFRSWSDRAGDPCVLTHPDFRGQGHGAAVVSRVAEAGFGAGILPIYQTLRSNTGAVAIARKLGYEDYASNWAIRLRPGAKV
jgi:GNAT superfamily N-acetyltransferase